MSKKTTVKDYLADYSIMEGIEGVTLGTKAGLVIQAIFSSDALQTTENLHVIDEKKLREWLRVCSDVCGPLSLHQALIEIYI